MSFLAFASIIRTVVIVGLAFVLLAPSLTLAQAAPYANTFSPTFITEKGAQLNGRANPSGMPDAFQWFEWGIVGHTEIYSTTHKSLRIGNVLVTTTADVVGLAPNTQYFYRQVVENGRGKSIGATITFTTKPLTTASVPLILVETDNPTFLSERSATLNGYVSPHGNTTGKYWFEWGKTAAFGNQTSVSNVSGSSKSTKSAITGLESGTMYYFRLVAEGSSGRSYGATKTFMTLGTNTASTTVTIPNINVGPVKQMSSAKKCIALTVNMAQHSRVSSVLTLQNFLTEKGFLKVQPTGYFGSMTVTAVKSYQRSKGIIQTGAVYALTRQAIKNDTCG